MIIRKMKPEDHDKVLAMMRVFYDSPALIHKSSNKVLEADIAACLDENMPLLDGYIFEEADRIIGYAMASLNFTTEYGGVCVWVEDLYLEEDCRHKGYGSAFFKFLEATYPQAVRFKLEVEQENENAVATYRKNGYQVSDYFLMTKEMVEG
ncbi:MAG: GNAT family N-acetyltransferase [Lachnospiraceae bacterium]|nr:GNAT family N-acetyltransferase [Lachnospiraceae bacterium]